MRFRFFCFSFGITCATLIGAGLLWWGSGVLAETVSISAANTEQVTELQQQVELKKLEIDKLQKKLDVYQKSLAAKQQEKITLTNELDILSEKQEQLKVELEKLNLQIDTTHLEIQAVLLEILDKEAVITRQRDQLGEFIRQIAQRDQQSYLDILATHASFSDFFDQVTRLEQVQGDITRSISELKIVKEELTNQQADLEAKSDELATLKDQLESTKAKIDSQETAKTYYLIQAKKSEKQFQSLIAQSKQEQEKINSDIVSLEKTIRQRLEQSGGGIQSTGRFIWPVPKNTITAYFHDPDYPFRQVFEHPAIDIRAGQGTPIKAADSGYVGKARDAGMGYSYIMLIHDNGLSTVYGHVSKIYVTADSKVNQGDIIGLSGATPGTPGAGPLTTGPHLHFEVRRNGIPVNPLEYLP